MPRHRDLQRLHQGVASWNAYRRQEPARAPDLRNAVLRGRDLAGCDLRQADLSGADLSACSLGDADLYRAELSRASLVGADLCDADLSRAVLTEADLSDAKLESANLLAAELGQARLAGADLSRADLGWVNFSRADLTRARLKEAVLIQAVFHRAVLDDADLTGALIASTIFAGVDLRRVRGLEAARYRNPSELSLSTFYLSQGQVPDALLQGAEVPGEFFDRNRGLFGRAGDYYSCFISYSHHDREFVHRLRDDLQAHGVRVWLDDHEILPGDSLYEAIDRGIRLWDKVLLCCSESSLNSRWVDLEVEKALEKEERLWKERGQRTQALIPLDLDGYLFDWRDAKASMLKSRFAPSFSSWKQDEASYRQQLGRLVRALRADAACREPPPESRL